MTEPNPFVIEGFHHVEGLIIYFNELDAADEALVVDWRQSSRKKRISTEPQVRTTSDAGSFGFVRGNVRFPIDGNEEGAFFPLNSDDVPFPIVNRCFGSAN